MTEKQRTIPLSVPVVGENEWAYVKECLDTGWISSAGRFVNLFEEKIADLLGVRFAVATSTGTAALHLALIAAGIEANDEVLLPTITFCASANAVCYLRAHPTFLDVNPRTWQLDADKLRSFLEESCSFDASGVLRNQKTGRVVRAIMPVHLFGHLCEMNTILELASEFRLLVIEDAAEAVGSSYMGQHAGSFGLASALSFNGNKIITAGGGGMLVTDDATVAEKARYLSTQARDSQEEYIHNAIGFNYRLTNIAAAIGLAQLERLPLFLKKKKRFAAYYRSSLSSIEGLAFQEEGDGARGNHWLTACRLTNGAASSSRTLIQALRKAGIDSRPLFHPLHSLPQFQDCFSFRIETAPALYASGLCLPSSVDLSESDLLRVVDAVRGFF